MVALPLSEHVPAGLRVSVKDVAVRRVSRRPRSSSAALGGGKQGQTQSKASRTLPRHEKVLQSPPPGIAVRRIPARMIPTSVLADPLFTFVAFVGSARTASGSERFAVARFENEPVNRDGTVDTCAGSPSAMTDGCAFDHQNRAGAFAQRRAAPLRRGASPHGLYVVDDVAVHVLAFSAEIAEAAEGRVLSERQVDRDARHRHIGRGGERRG